MERRCVAYLLAAPAALRRVPLEAGDIGDLACARIVAVMRELDAQGVTPHSGAVQRALLQRDERDTARLALELVREPHGLADIAGPVEHLRDLAERRRIRDPLLRIAAMAERGELAEARAALETLSVGDSAEAPAVLRTPDVVRATLHEVERRARLGGRVDLGPDLRGLSDHLVPGFMTVVGGETNAGKSQLAWLIARRYAPVSGRPSGVVSCEDMAYVYGDRTVAYEGGADGRSLLSGDEDGRLTPAMLEDAERVAREAEHGTDHMRLSVVPDGDLDRVIAAIRHLVRDEGCGLVVVDYLSRLRVEGQAKPGIYELVRAAVPRLKAEVMRLGVPLVLVSQLNRREGREFAEPRKSELLGGSVIEQAAEAIALVWREDEEATNSLVRIAKLKAGRSGGRAELVRNAGGMVYHVQSAPPPQPSRGGW
jgi:replicative DNA helicase